MITTQFNLQAMHKVPDATAENVLRKKTQKTCRDGADVTWQSNLLPAWTVVTSKEWSSTSEKTTQKCNNFPPKLRDNDSKLQFISGAVVDLGHSLLLEDNEPSLDSVPFFNFCSMWKSKKFINSKKNNGMDE